MEDLKNSLSLTLQRFFPFAGKLKLPPPPQRPCICYVDGDSVAFVVTESTAEFKHLAGNHLPRRGQDLESLVPKLAQPSTSSDGNNFCKLQSLMAIQVTIFPNAGISIGVTFSHVAADGRAFSRFTKSWASICRSAGDLTTVNNCPPDHSRDLIQDPIGIWSIFLKETLDTEPESLTGMNPPTDNVRITPVISQSQVEMLKKWIARKCAEENPRLSTFVVTAAFMWVCLIKFQQSNQSLSSDNGICLFVFQADCRDRLGLPTNYFGNCLKPCLVTAKRSELIEENGVSAAAKAIRREIQEFEKEPLKGVENWLSSAKEFFIGSEQYVTLAGSPKFRFYETDFGFGKPPKTDLVHIGSHGSISIAESRDEEGGIEFGFALASAELHKFNAIFEQGLLNLH